MPDVTLTVDGKKVTAPAGTLLIEACKSAGIEVPSFCYYPNLVAAGRLPHVPGEGREDAQAADRLHHCRSAKAWSSSTDSDEVRQARKGDGGDCCSATIRSTARCAMRAASANCRT